jgi:DNA uptake protein ComE-like DNA-binding protein
MATRRKLLPKLLPLPIAPDEAKIRTSGEIVELNDADAVELRERLPRVSAAQPAHKSHPGGRRFESG